MVIFLIVFCILFAALVVFLLYMRRFSSPYKLYMVFGKKGAGKTTYMAKLACQYHKKGWNIYSNIDLPYARVFDTDYIGVASAPENTVLLIDEVGMIWDNRDFKNFKPEVRDYFKLQRHYKHIVYLFSQTFDVDLKLRNLTDGLFLITSPVSGISIIRRIARRVTLLQPTPETEGRIADSLEFVPLFMNLFGARAFQFTFIPKYAKLFDSFDAPELQPLSMFSRETKIFIPPPQSFKIRFRLFIVRVFKFYILNLYKVKIYFKRKKRK